MPARTATGPFSGTPIAQALRSAATAIGAAGSTTPRLDAELLLAHTLGVSRERLIIDRALEVPQSRVRAFREAVRRRAVEREPVAYITGWRAFRALDLAVDARALIPRPETELLVEIGLGLARDASVLDLGTGSGAVALALKHERPDLDVTGSDRDAGALGLARENGARLGLEVRWRQADLFDGLPERFDAVLSNPPYVAEEERAALAPEILRHEPPGALFGGPGGLGVIGPLLGQAAARGTPLVAVEVGAGQASAAIELARAAGFATAQAQLDLAGIERVIVARS